MALVLVYSEKIKMLIYEINTLSWIHDLTIKYKRKINLDNIPDSEWQKIIDLNFQAVWLMGVWKRSPRAITINLKDKEFIDLAKKTQLNSNNNIEDQIAGSAYSIKDYSLNLELGDDKDSLIRLKKKLNSIDLKLILDFVPNHVALDHLWAIDHPEYFIQGSELEYKKPKQTNYVKINNNIYALGRDPEYDPWNDVLQLNIFSEELRKSHIAILNRLAKQCDGVRCDMAMLMLDYVFKQNWNFASKDIPKVEYWQLIISQVKKVFPNFVFIAECYWETQEQLINLGFDYCYDKEFYDYLVNDQVYLLKKRLNQILSTQDHYLRFIENHDEPRSAEIIKDINKLKSSIILLMSVPGGKLFYEGQLEGRKIPTLVQLRQSPEENINDTIYLFYVKLLHLFKDINNAPSQWRVLDTDEAQDIIILFWKNIDRMYLVVINWSQQEQNFNYMLNNLSSKSQIIFNTMDSQVNIQLTDNNISLQMLAYQTIIIEI